MKRQFCKTSWQDSVTINMGVRIHALEFYHICDSASTLWPRFQTHTSCTGLTQHREALHSRQYSRCHQQNQLLLGMGMRDGTKATGWFSLTVLMHIPPHGATNAIQ